MARNVLADELMKFIQVSPTAFHAVASSSQVLRKWGAQELVEGEAWNLEAGRAYFLTRQQSSLIAFQLPATARESCPFTIAAAHTDSPALKLKPRSGETLANYQQWGVEIYGGVLLNSWLDRDLCIAGKLSWHDGFRMHTTLIHLEEIKFRIPQLAIHLDRNVNENGLILNPQRHMQPVLGLSEGQNQTLRQLLLEKAQTAFPSFGTQAALALGLVPNAFAGLSFDLFFVDTQPPSYGGLNDEFIYAPRLDNLAMTHAALKAFCLKTSPVSTIPVIALFDHEEVGSQSVQGAHSNFLPSILERITLALGFTRQDFLANLTQSFMISADMAHALHPNYPEKHEPQHFPLLNQGPVLKANANMRYASQGESSAYFQSLCRRAEVPLQNFINRADLACGSTVGPVLAGNLGIPTVDIGNPMLSMHSIREMAGSVDHGLMIKVLQEFLGQ